MAKKKKPTEETPTGAALVPRLEKLERAFRELTGVKIEEYEESEADNPVVETKEFDSAVVKTHKDGKLEFLKKCPYCNTPVADLATHKAKCPKRPIY